MPRGDARVLRRLRHAVDWRLRAIVGRLDEIERQVRAAQPASEPARSADTRRLEQKLDALRATLDDEVRPLLRTLVADEAGARRRLIAARAGPHYARAWADPDPLVTVTIAARERPELLASRALPSVLSQTHQRLEVLVVGDAAAPEVERAVAAIGDPRVRWANLTHRVDAHPDPQRHWLAGSTLARNEARRRAQGSWLLHFDDDDRLRADTVELLLERARETQAEVVYGGYEEHGPAGPTTWGPSFPPTAREFGWQGALHHADLPFERELVAAHLGIAGDAWLLERMLRAGVQFAMVDRVVWDYFPSTVWR